MVRNVLAAVTTAPAAPTGDTYSPLRRRVAAQYAESRVAILALATLSIVAVIALWAERCERYERSAVSAMSGAL